MDSKINYEAIAQPTDLKQEAHALNRVILVGIIIFVAVICAALLYIALPASQMIKDDIVTGLGFVSIIILPIVLVILIGREQKKRPAQPQKSDRWTSFAAANGFTFVHAKNGQIMGDLDDSGSILLSTRGDITNQPVGYPILDYVPLPWRQYTLQGEHDGLHFLFANYSLGMYGLGLAQFRFASTVRFYSLSKISDPRISQIPDFICIRKDLPPRNTMLNFRFTHSDAWYQTQVGMKADVTYDTLTHYDPPVSLEDDALSSLLADLFTISQAWIECHDGSFFLVHKKMFASDAEDLSMRFAAVERVAQYLDQLPQAEPSA